MIRFVKHLWSHAPFATLILAVSLLVAGVFATRSVALWIYWNDPAHRAQALEPWMTPKYISHSWRVPTQVVVDALGDFERAKKGPMRLEQIAAELDVTPETLIDRIDQAITDYQADTKIGTPRKRDGA
ncbi:hypothetical protein EDD53_0896 [Pacificibacter maritimus]|uniref:Uncharacterized protein n=1 Tax=Pacificibacter maritimus TaxID=762213 RepID=A0A3N4UP10_9RHOB|nr:hypothetical protein [Pacificibacter maritimus]RPE71768.1 hypothetical protein EDD53_0896 [Pacificibacter maritimus]